MVEVYVDLTHHEESEGPVIGLDLTVDYSEGRATLSIPVAPPLSYPPPQSEIAERMRRLAEALLDGARTPQRIHVHLSPSTRST